MTRISTTVDVSAFTTDAKFRTWGTAISAALVSCGLIQTGDTGQIDWTTVLKAVAINTKQGYQIYRFNDSLQGSAPIFLKLEFGSGGTATGNSPQMWLQVGKGTDGAGNLTGLKSAIVNGSTTANTGVTALTAVPVLMTHTDGYLLCYSGEMTLNNANDPFWFIIDRTSNQITGAPTTEGYSVVHTVGQGGTSQSLTYRYCYSTAVAAQTYSGYGATMPPGDSSTYEGSLFPSYAILPHPLISVGMVGHMAAEIAQYSTFTCKPIGTTMTRTYIALGANTGITGTGYYQSDYCSTNVTGVTNEAGVRTAYLWED